MMNRLDYVITSPSRQSQRSCWWDEDIDSQFFSSFSSSSSSSQQQDTQSTGIYLFSNFNTDENTNNNNRKSSLSYRAKNVLLHPFKTTSTTTRRHSSLKTKLKSRIFSKTSNTQQNVDFPDETADSIKVVTRKKLSSTVQKLMEKSLGLFRIRPRKEKDTINIYKNPPSPLVSDNQCGNLNELEPQIYTTTTNDLDQCCSELKTSEFLLVPSMCSSFELACEEGTCVHSTPCSFARQFSPIIRPCYENQRSIDSSAYQISSPSTSSTIYSERRHMFQRRRLSFGATSSPTSMSSSNISQRSSSNQCSANQLRYLEHINKIKKNIKLEVEMRNLKEELGRIETSEREEAGNMMMPSKKRKLQHIFRLNLKKQLREMKKSQIGIKIKYSTTNPKLIKKTDSCYFGHETTTTTPKHAFSSTSKRFKFDDAECDCFRCVHSRVHIC